MSAALILPLALELTKFVIMEQRIRQLAAQAGASPEQLEEVLTKLRAEVAAMDPTKLPEV